MSNTEVLLEKIELVSIISVTELRLQQNFELVVRCLKEHAGRLDSMERWQLEQSQQAVEQ